MRKRLSILIVLLAFTFALTGCTEEKARALKLSADQFVTQAGIALNSLEAVLIGNTAMPEIPIESISTDLEDVRGSFNYPVLAHMMQERDFGISQSNELSENIIGLKSQYTAFNSIFRSLEQGNMLAGDAVKRAERHCINLSVQLINISDLIKQGKIETRLNSERILLYESISANQAIEDPDSRKQHLELAAQSIVDLKRQENELKADTILALLTAAELGKRAAESIHDYGKLSVNDLLQLVDSNLEFVSTIGGSDALSLVDEYTEIADMLRNDPYWSGLIDVPIN